MVDVLINTGDAHASISAAHELLVNGRPLFKAISQALEYQTEQNFEAEGRPEWVPLSAATIRERKKRNKGSSLLKILQDRGILASSVSSGYGSDFSEIGAGGAARDYAAIQQEGGTIERAPYSVKTRLRTDRKGNLLRQGSEGSAKGRAVFAKDSHKSVLESWNEVKAYSIKIPGRPYLPYFGSGANATLQPEAATSILDVVESMISARMAK